MKRYIIILCAIPALLWPGYLAATKLDADIIEKKKKGWYVTGMPLLNYSTDYGVGYGAGVYCYYNGTDEDEGFDETPYFTRIYGQFFQTTGGWSQHQLTWDQFRLFKTTLRIRAAMTYESKTNANYFGIGSRTTARNLEDSNFTTHGTWEDYYRRFLKNNYLNFARGKWWHFVDYKYNSYQSTEPSGYLDLFGRLPGDVPVLKHVEYMAGFQGENISIRRWDLRGYHVNGRRFVELNPTKLNLERPRGYRGGWSNFLRLGVAFDTLDYEPDPTKGVRAEYCLETSQRFFGSDYVYYRNTFGLRWYQPWFKGFIHVLRLAYTTAARDVPFFEMNRFPFLWNRETGLGGTRTLRGYKADRFVGRTMTLANFELRYHVGDAVIPVLGRFGLKIIGFVEAGNVYDKPGYPFSHPRWDDYRYCYGGGIVVPWNLATILHLYAGFSREDFAVSLDFEHAIR